MSALVIGDLHLSGDNLAETGRACTDIVNEVQAFPYRLVVFMGDINHTFRTMHLGCIRVFFQMIAEIENCCPLIVILVGNHDRPNNQHFLTDEHPFHALLTHAKVRVAATSVLDLTLDEKRYAFAPYVPDGRLDSAFGASNLDANDPTWHAAFSHQLWKGSLGNPLADEQGDEWPLNRCHMFSGHVHGYKELQPNLTIVGAAMQHHASDSQDRAVLRLDLATLKYTRLRLMSVPLKHQNACAAGDLEDVLEKCNTLDQYVIDVTGEREAIRAVLTRPSVQKLLHMKRISVRPKCVRVNPACLGITLKRLDFLTQVATHLPPDLAELHATLLRSVRIA